MATHTTVPTALFTRDQQYVLRVLRQRYQQDRDFFTAPERARLRFLRWLCQTARLVP